MGLWERANLLQSGQVPILKMGGRRKQHEHLVSGQVERRMEEMHHSLGTSDQPRSRTVVVPGALLYPLCFGLHPAHAAYEADQTRHYYDHPHALANADEYSGRIELRTGPGTSGRALKNEQLYVFVGAVSRD